MMAQNEEEGPITMHYNGYKEGSKVGKPETLEVDMVIGGDGANSRVAREMNAGEYDYAIAFQERIRISDDKMEYYKDLAEMYVGDDVSPDFYGWVFPKYDHVAVGEPPAAAQPGLQCLCTPPRLLDCCFNSGFTAAVHMAQLKPPLPQSFHA